MYYERDLITKKQMDKQKKKNKKTKFQKIRNNYINNKHLIDPTFIYERIPKKIRKEKIKSINIVPQNNKIIICYTYEITKKKIKPINIEKLSLDKKLELSVSIDLGMKNIFAIYNPTGKQYLFPGKGLARINDHFNVLIDSLKSQIAKTKNNKNKSKQLQNLLEQKRKMSDAYINLLIIRIKKLYSEKQIFIIGYNEGWKTGVKLGKKNNRRFYEIPFARIIKRLRQSLENEGKTLVTLNEAYTSKCDALALEPIEKHEQYSGCRIKRGLFQSKMNGKKEEKKLINADLNGAINILRKRYPETNEIKGENIFNPEKQMIELFKFKIKKARRKRIKKEIIKKIYKKNKKEK
jgi:IS605 OrfB family transposase